MAKIAVVTTKESKPLYVLKVSKLDSRKAIKRFSKHFNQKESDFDLYYKLIFVDII